MTVTLLKTAVRVMKTGTESSISLVFLFICSCLCLFVFRLDLINFAHFSFFPSVAAGLCYLWHQSSQSVFQWSISASD